MNTLLISHKSVVKYYAGTGVQPYKYGGSSLTRKPQPYNGCTRLQRKIAKWDKDNTPQFTRLHSLSPRSKSKIQDKLNSWFHQTAVTAKRTGKKTNFSFVTLTFINKVDHDKATKILNKFLTVARRHKPYLNYLWVAERQPKNNDFPLNVHFHIFTNDYWDIERFNRLWVTCQVNSGILSPSYKKSYGEPVAWHTRKVFNAQKKRYVSAYNPFDVKKIKQYKTLTFYITKYVTKQNNQFGFRPYHCSVFISRLCTNSRTPNLPLTDRNGHYMDAHDYALTHEHNWYVNKQTGELVTPKVNIKYMKEQQNKPPKPAFISVPVYNYSVVKNLLSGLHNNNHNLYENSLSDVEIKHTLKYIMHHYKMYLMRKKGLNIDCLPATHLRTKKAVKQILTNNTMDIPLQFLG